MKKKRFYRIMKHMAAICLVGGMYAIWTERTGIGIPCLFRLITGRKCPGCGVTSMCIALLHLDFTSAFSSNPVIFCLLPVYAFFVIKNIRRYIMTGQYRMGRPENGVLAVSIVVLLIFGIMRNF